ncbi:phenylalanine--tRNA ligase subunit beta [Exilibacterium tricleocarpae]|uniref:Phenylalanine--tRNA ligase beta subunit n=1 Tax=Exilibacterium tricleocarpae TaxID=2591008 RepID=A0A545U434_9GAMM|nr:phenylalanine--tRNA ligase subunit beta [Exilibacterium tricleocarpae]TQV84251.1 phenylalanine--tRNA ligase subunit beta [Exilibacterium tricleocarpae]
MKLSESWLREWVNPNLNTAELVEQITMAGLEVDATEAVAGAFSGVVVGEILSVEQHPNADKLRVCQVAGGAEVAQVVCGAPNARAGIKVPFATVGAKLPGNFKIKKAKLRGVESCGMLCAQTELEAGDDASGLWELPGDAPTGAVLQDFLGLNDTIIELDLTPNRGDCLSIKGVARDVGVLNRLPVVEPDIAPVSPGIDDTLPVTLEAGARCSRYVGRVIRNVDLSRSSPTWMQERLRRSGVRSIDPVVDVTNYVLLELGQPMHAFDLNTLEQGIVVRMARAGEPLKLLDGQDVKLSDDTLVIADAGKAVAMAGIMGGAETAVGAGTKDIFLESAFFDPIAIAGRARAYGLHTDSSHRFERGVDFRLQEQAVERATQLLLDIVGGAPGPVTVTELAEEVPTERRVTLRRERIHDGLGFAMDDADVVDILSRLGLTQLDGDAQGWTFGIPSYRFDIALEEDLLEELARIYGYNRLPTTSFSGQMRIQPQPETLRGLAALRQQLIARGYREAITYSFVDPALLKLLDPQAEPVTLQNPISAEMAVMRTTLWAGLVQAVLHNIHRQQSRVRLFEAGLRFVPGSRGLAQEPVLAGVIYGQRHAENWGQEADPSDFYDLKGDLESLLTLTGDEVAFSFVSAAHPALHPGQSAAILNNGTEVGYIGTIHPQIQQSLGLSQPIFLFEIAQSALREARLPKFRELSKFPEVRRDIAVIVDQSQPVETLRKVASKKAGDYLRELKVFDLYVGKGIDPHRKSVALGLTFQHPSRTLTEDEINASMDAVVRSLEVEFNATLR